MAGPWAQRSRRADKIAPAIAALIVNAAIGYAFIMGLRGAPLSRVLTDSTPLALFDLSPEVQEKKPVPLEPKKPRVSPSEGGGSPPPKRPHLIDKDMAGPPPAIVAPVPAVVVPVPMVAPPVGDGGQVGTGDGNGEGNGSGGSGTGTGAGTGHGEGNGGKYSSARQTGGRFRNSDFPDWLRGVGTLKIGVRYAIGPSGHVDNCEVIEKSGYPEVDSMTCRIIVERYRFRPAKDPDGYAVTEVREEDYRWRVR